MSDSPNIKAEIKKSVVTEPIKILIRLLLTLVGTLILAAIPQVRAHLWPAIPKWSLLVLAAAFLSAVLALVPYVAYLRRKVRAVESELNELKSEPQYPYKFGLKWDEALNPRCPHCEAHLSAPQFVHQKTRPNLSFFDCQGCGSRVFITDESGVGHLRFKDAKAQMTALTGRERDATGGESERA